MSALGVSSLSGAEKVAPVSAKCSSAILSDAGGELGLVGLGAPVGESGIADALDGPLRETSRGGLQSESMKYSEKRNQNRKKERNKK
jgi:hypothetical protein